MEQLGQKDHDALVLRFFENKNFSEVGAALGASEDAAKMRVSRALEKLRKFFTKRGVNSTTDIISGAISANSVLAAPAMLAKTATAVALAKGATASISTLTLIKGALKIMAWTKTKPSIVVSAGLLLAAGTATVAVKRNAELNSWRVMPPDYTALKRVPPQVRILPTKFSSPGGYGADGGKMMGIGETIVSIAQVAYANPNENNWDSARTIVSPDVPQGRYDFIANLSSDSLLRFRIK